MKENLDDDDDDVLHVYGIFPQDPRIISVIVLFRQHAQISMVIKRERNKKNLGGTVQWVKLKSLQSSLCAGLVHLVGGGSCAEN